MKTIQLKAKSMQEQSVPDLDGTEEARRATGIPSRSGQPQPPDPEVTEKKPRRRFTVAYKLRILKEYDSCTEPGQIGALLRREGPPVELKSLHQAINRSPNQDGQLYPW